MREINGSHSRSRTERSRTERSRTHIDIGRMRADVPKSYIILYRYCVVAERRFFFVSYRCSNHLHIAPLLRLNLEWTAAPSCTESDVYDVEQCWLMYFATLL